MPVFVATAGGATATTIATLGRFHSSAKGDQPFVSTGRQRSSSVNSRLSSSSATSIPDTAPMHSLSSKIIAMSIDTLNKGVYQQEQTIFQRDLSASKSESINRAQQQCLEDGFDRILHLPIAIDHNGNNSSNNNDLSHGSASQRWLPLSSPTDQNCDLPAENAPANVPMICTGRSRSNTLTTTSTGAVDVTAASISNQYDHIMRPRRLSQVNRPLGQIAQSSPAIPTLILPQVSSDGSVTAPSHVHSHYPPDSILPQYNDIEAAAASSNTRTLSNTHWSNIQLGFLPRIVLLIGIFCMSLGGLYLLAQVLPPMSLPKSIDDVKVDAAILQEFATATYEGWLRTFWVFSAVYIWKQCFGIPGSAFLNILAGALYGPWFGTILTSLLTTLGSVLAYFMSFFLMEPILNRYASSRLDQMRLQVQKKTKHSSSKKKSMTGSTATSTAVQTSINIPSSLSSDPEISNSPPTQSSIQQASLRTRSSSFILRKTDLTTQDLSSSTHPYPDLANIATRYNNNEIQEHEALLNEGKENEDSMLSIDHQEHVIKEHETNSEDDEDDSEGTSLFMQLLLIRLFPLTPYWFINLASPLVGVPVIPFMTSMFLGVMPYNYICAQAGAILSEIHELRDIYQQPWILFQVVFVLLLCTVGVLVSKRSKKNQQEKEQRKSRTSDERTDDETTHRLLRPDFDDAEQHRHERRRDEEHMQDSISMSTLGHGRLHDLESKRNESAVIDMGAYRY
ncbi:Transmembrane protein 41A [Lobosporangium transversale]|uniref:Golgi apparatus membrane protein TVP38 n=1 Tax=Lobosporangium transversale TaxID=64571 RepID=A0A1Y2GWY4_9FUNG|nr:hypothetical protein BCR41DRAFT_384436 [Lobosporangium transversale]KAF9907376.1 Transmembrane protein 41A [Lobosporangium transversale]ORZ26324.1 hypothetical protein BCR41DRAFT_384436 [Lobosporangium transversale]|eukprot:XP_021884089.1 hypothetical protein BCR41DRAFT_384436 [Lobosporangium transversale]